MDSQGYLLAKFFPKDSIAIAQQVAREPVKGECFPQLLFRPLCGGMDGHVEVDNARRSWANTRNT